MGAGAALSGFWAERSPRERSVLLAGAAIVAAAALYGLLWEPGLEARARLSVALPRLRAQLEDMRMQAREIDQLRRTLGPLPRNADLLAIVRASVQRSALQRSIERVEWRSADRVVVAASSVAFDQWIDWLRALQRDLGVRVDSCEVVALPQPGKVRVEAVLAGTRGT